MFFGDARRFSTDFNKNFDFLDLSLKDIQTQSESIYFICHVKENLNQAN